MNRRLTAILALVFPQRMICHACAAPLSGEEGLLCEDCERSLAACALAGARAETVVDERITLAVSAFCYDSTAAILVKALKFGGDCTAALPLAEGMARVVTEFSTLREADFCVPVPTHYKRFRRRGYNQAMVLASALSDFVGLPVRENALLRVHHKRSQISFGRDKRLANITGAFAVSHSDADRLCGKRVLLIDDVLTTGATAMECANTLYAAGAQSVQLLTACRV